MGEEEVVDFVEDVLISVFEEDVHGEYGDWRCRGRLKFFHEKKKVEKGYNVRFTGYLIQHKSKKLYDSRLSTSLDVALRGDRTTKSTRYRPNDARMVET